MILVVIRLFCKYTLDVRCNRLYSFYREKISVILARKNVVDFYKDITNTNVRILHNGNLIFNESCYFVPSKCKLSAVFLEIMCH